MSPNGSPKNSSAKDIRTSCLSEQDIFDALAVWHQRRTWDEGPYKAVQCLNMYNVEQVGKRFSQITEK